MGDNVFFPGAVMPRRADAEGSHNCNCAVAKDHTWLAEDAIYVAEAIERS
ncbi:MAG: hypothetical protein QOD12_745 [Verrucomicrobiota bacterium]|jgi:hypothetical protein